MSGGQSEEQDIQKANLRRVNRLLRSIHCLRKGKKIDCRDPKKIGEPSEVPPDYCEVNDSLYRVSSKGIAGSGDEGDGKETSGSGDGKEMLQGTTSFFSDARRKAR